MNTIHFHHTDTALNRGSSNKLFDLRFEVEECEGDEGRRVKKSAVLGTKTRRYVSTQILVSKPERTYIFLSLCFSFFCSSSEKFYEVLDQERCPTHSTSSRTVTNVLCCV